MKNIYLRHPHLINSIIIALLVAVVYCKVAGQEFLVNWDDVDYITANEGIRGLTFQNLKDAFGGSYFGNYAPLHLLSYMIDYSIWGLNPAAFKATNVVLHAGCTLAFYRLLLLVGLTMPQAFVASLLFAVHPVQVESVAWASQRKNPLSLLFFLGAWYAWLRWKKDETGSKPVWYTASLCLFLLALLSKSVAVILPLFLLAHELILEKKPFTRRSLTSIMPYVGLTAACIVIAMATHKGGEGGIVGYHGGSLGVTMMNMLPVFSRYLILLLFPFGLTFIYNAPLKAVPDATILLSAALFILFIIGWLRLRKARPAQAFWLSLFVMGLLPVSNIVPIVTMMNDRYLYYPMLGAAPFAVVVAAGAIERLQAHRAALSALLATLVVGAFSVMSWKQVDVWKNSVTLWSDAMAKTTEGTWYESPENTNFINEGYIESLVVYATRMKRDGRYDEAERYCLLALTSEPTNYHALGLLSQIYIDEKKPLAARPYLLRLVAAHSDSDAGHNLLGQSYLMTGELAQAREHFEIALRLNPQNSHAAENLELLHSPAPSR